MYEDRNRESRQVIETAMQKIYENERKMIELQSLHDELAHLADSCKSDSRPDCPIIKSFSS